MAKNEDAAPARDAASARNERASARSAGEPSREVSRKRADERKYDERKYSDRRRRQDLDEATNAVRQMRRDNTVDEVVEREAAPRFSDGPPRRLEVFGDDDSPRVVNEPPPRFGLFGN